MGKLLTILEIKMREINVTEMACLKPFVDKLQTYAIADLWVIEDKIRLKEKHAEFDQTKDQRPY